jgi:hypothetical protein
MDQAVKTSVLHDIVGKMGAGGAGITTSAWLDFVEAQNDGYQRPRRRGKGTGLCAIRSARPNAILERIDGVERLAVGLQPQRRLVTLLPQPAR